MLRKDLEEANEEDEPVGVLKAKSGGGDDAGSKLRRGKTVEQIYQKKTQVEHILLRPDTYVGSKYQALPALDQVLNYCKARGNHLTS